MQLIATNPTAAKNDAGQQQQPKGLPKADLSQLKNLRHGRVPEQLENENGRNKK